MSVLKYLDRVEWPFCLGFPNPATTAFNRSLFRALSVLSIFFFPSPLPAFSLSCFSPNFWFQLQFQSFCCLTPCRIWSGRQSGGHKHTLQWGLWQWGMWGCCWGGNPWGSAPCEGLWRQRKDGINEAGCEGFLACFQGLCSSSSSSIWSSRQSKSGTFECSGGIETIRMIFLVWANRNFASLAVLSSVVFFCLFLPGIGTCDCFLPLSQSACLDGLL